MKKERSEFHLLGRFRSVQTSLYLMMSVMILIAVGVVTVISLQYTRAAIFENTTTYTGKLTTQVNSDIDSYMDYMENISSMLAEDSDVQKILFDEEENREAKRQVQSRFSTVLTSRPDIYNLGIIQAEGRALLNTGNDEVNPYVKIKNLSWYEEAVKKQGQVCFSSAHVQHVVKNQRPWVITLSRYIKNVQENMPGAVLFVDLNYSAIRTLCEENSVGKKGYIFILDADGNIVYHPQQQQLYNELQTEYTEEVKNCKENYLQVGKGDDTRLYTISRSKKTGWTVVSCSYISELLKKSKQAQSLYLIMAVLLVIIALITSSLIAKGITGPIKRLQSSMALVQEGNFQAGNVEVEFNNEIGDLTKSFNAMTKRIQELMEQNINEQKAKRKSELKALQSQINPHFLYNTLDSIIWMAEGKKNEEVVLMTASLARLLRQNISNEDEQILIYQEAEYCKNYLIIQKMRYKDKLEFEIDVDPAIQNEKIIKLVLQPLIENAIYHGLKYKESKGLLIVKGYEDGRNIRFEIRDNGVGMDEDTLANIFKKHAVDFQSNGVGVYNVQKRIQLTYGSEYGISYKSRVGEGTVATVTIPKGTEGFS